MKKLKLTFVFTFFLNLSRWTDELKCYMCEGDGRFCGKADMKEIVCEPGEQCYSLRVEKPIKTESKGCATGEDSKIMGCEKPNCTICNEDLCNESISEGTLVVPCVILVHLATLLLLTGIIVV